MPGKTLKTKKDCMDFLTGLKLLGTGGGGSTASGKEMLLDALDAGLTLKWVDAADLPDDICTCTAFGSGSISEDTPTTLAEINALGEKIGVPNKYGYGAIEVAINELANYAGVDIGAIVPVELGASNTPAPLVTAAKLGIAMVDGDFSGRAVPQDMQTTYFLKGIPTYPAAIVDWWGNVLILKEAATTEMGERIGKMLSMASYGVVYIASMLLSAKDTQDLVVPGTLSLSLELGKSVRNACDAGRDPIAEAVRVLDGWELFNGEVVGKDWEDKDGVMVGTTHINGKGKYEGQMMDVWFLNENHIAWLNGKPFVFSPDLIILADPESGEGYTNTEVKRGDAVSVLGAKTYPVFRSELGLKYFGPQFWGFDFDYVPIEEALAKQ